MSETTWEISGHNGIQVDAAAGVASVDRAFAKRMRVVSLETDDAYIEFAVEKDHARRLRDYLNEQRALLNASDTARIRAEEALRRILEDTFEDWPMARDIARAALNNPDALVAQQVEAAGSNPAHGVSSNLTEGTNTSYPEADEETEERTCEKCGFSGYVVACVWAGEEGCMLPALNNPEVTKETNDG